MKQREIKFRYWNGKQMVAGFNFHVCADSGNVFECSAGSYGGTPQSVCPGSSDKVQDAVVMQYTGLKDKNGKEIYEGDILQYRYHRDTTGHDYSEYTEVVDWETDNASHVTGFYIKPHHNPEIIGNIYENPDLLK